MCLCPVCLCVRNLHPSSLIPHPDRVPRRIARTLSARPSGVPTSPLPSSTTTDNRRKVLHYCSLSLTRQRHNAITPHAQSRDAPCVCEIARVSSQLMLPSFLVEVEKPQRICAPAEATLMSLRIGCQTVDRADFLRRQSETATHTAAVLGHASRARRLRDNGGAPL